MCLPGTLESVRDAVDGEPAPVGVDALSRRTVLAGGGAAALAALKRAAGPRRYGDIADQMYDEGYRHGVTVKNPDRQLKDSIWVAMNEDDRFVKVGSGVFDLASRQPAA